MPVTILGIDPGSRKTGYALLEIRGGAVKALVCDTLDLNSHIDPHQRLKVIYEHIEMLVDTYRPDCCAIETPVYGKDPLAMLKLGRAQASVIMAVLHRNIPLFEYYPKAVKKSVTGNGNASKTQVAYMIAKLVQTTGTELSHDASDALAIAWCHYQKLSGTADTESSVPTTPSNRSKNSWTAFVSRHPDRIREQKPPASRKVATTDTLKGKANTDTD